MPRLPVHTLESALELARLVLEEVRDHNGPRLITLHKLQSEPQSGHVSGRIKRLEPV
jgi:hypothetical protein